MKYQPLPLREKLLLSLTALLLGAAVGNAILEAVPLETIEEWVIQILHSPTVSFLLPAVRVCSVAILIGLSGIVLGLVSESMKHTTDLVWKKLEDSELGAWQRTSLQILWLFTLAGGLITIIAMMAIIELPIMSIITEGEV